MKKAELIDVLASKVSLTKKDSTEAVNATFEEIARRLEKGEDVDIPGFGKFTTVKKAAREGRNPATGAAMTIPASTAVKFKVSKTLKERVNK